MFQQLFIYALIEISILIKDGYKYAMQIHRKPPKPIYYDNFTAGQCRYCGDMILKKDGSIKTAANWHKGCLEAYKQLHWSSHTRKAVWRRDNGLCAECGSRSPTPKGPWHVDHIKPLVEAHGDIDYWRLDNLQTLCVPCHKLKTSSEATARASARRAALELIRSGPPTDSEA